MNIFTTIRQMTPEERNHMRQNLMFGHAIQSLIERYKLSEKIITDRFDIPARNFQDFVAGSFPYTFKHKSIFNELEINLSKNGN